MAANGGIGGVISGAALSLVGWLALPSRAFAEQAPAASPPPAPVSSTVSDPLVAGGILNVVLSLGLVLLAIWGAAWLMRRLSLMQAPAGGAMKLLGGLAVGQRERVVLVQVGETQLLLGVAPGEVRTLHVLDKPVEVAPQPGEGFAERLSQFMGDRIAGRGAAAGGAGSGAGEGTK